MPNPHTAWVPLLTAIAGCSSARRWSGLGKRDASVALDAAPAMAADVEPALGDSADDSQDAAARALARRSIAGLAASAVASRGFSVGAESTATSPPSKLNLTQGIGAEDLVYPGWFRGTWRCAAELVSLKPGPGGEAALRSSLKGMEAGLQASRKVLGTASGVKQAKCRWDPFTEFATEEDGGINAGTIAAALSLLGPSTTLKALPDQESVFEASNGPTWLLLAAGAVGKPDVDGPGTFRVTEVFNVEAPDSLKKKPERILGTVRVVTVYRRPPLDSEAGAKAARFLQGVQTTQLLGAPAQAGVLSTEVLAEYTRVLAFSPA